jgi:methionine-rich copper-binding protein CopC
LLLAFILIYCAWAVTPALAHALLLRSNPASNAALEQAPAQVELFFSEPVESNLSTVFVLDANGQEVDLGDVRVDPSDPTRMTVSLGSLLNGVYTDAWKAISAIDGHLTNGSLPFAIGTESSSALAGQTQKTSSQLPLSALVSKWRRHLYHEPGWFQVDLDHHGCGTDQWHGLLDTLIKNGLKPDE